MMTPMPLLSSLSCAHSAVPLSQPTHMESSTLSGAAYRAFRAEASHNAETVRRIAELTYREGRGTILELLDTYSSYLRVEEQALELRGAALFAAVELEQAIGPVSR